MPKKRNIYVDGMVDTLRDAIVSGELKPRESLVETDLAEKFNVSRTPVREAIRRLAALGLVKVERYKGAIIADINADEIRDIYTVRANIEGLAAKLATTKIPESKFDDLKGCLANMDAAAKDWDLLRFASENEKFHRTIYSFCGNKYLCTLIDELLERTATFRRASWQSPRNIKISKDGHKKILAAIMERNEKKAQEAVENHIRLLIADQ